MMKPPTTRRTFGIAVLVVALLVFSGLQTAAMLFYAVTVRGPVAAHRCGRRRRE